MLLKALSVCIPNYSLQGLFTGELATSLHNSILANNVDKQAMEIASHWADDCNFKFYQGVDVTAGVRHLLVKDILLKNFKQEKV